MDLERLAKDVARTRNFVLFVAVAAPAAYGLWFFVVNNAPLSLQTGDWGAFGDFVGGLVNPLVAFFAFYWLTRSVLIQKEELSETRSALVESQRAQERQAELALVSAKLQSLNAELETVKERLSAKLDYRNIIIQHGHNGSGYVPVMDSDGVLQNAKKLLTDLNPEITELEKKQAELLSKIADLAQTT